MSAIVPTVTASLKVVAFATVTAFSSRVSTSVPAGDTVTVVGVSVSCGTKGAKVNEPEGPDARGCHLYLPIHLAAHWLSMLGSAAGWWDGKTSLDGGLRHESPTFVRSFRPADVAKDELFAHLQVRPHNGLGGKPDGSPANKRMTDLVAFNDGCAAAG